MASIFRKKIVTILAIAAFMLLAYVAFYLWQLIPIGSAYKAKVLCSGVFISKCDPRDILRQELEGPTNILSEQIDYAAKSVTVSFPGTPDQRAVYREGLGCTLLAGVSADELLKQGNAAARSGLSSPDVKAHPAGSAGLVKDFPHGVTAEKFSKMLDKAVTEKTRAVIILYDGRMIVERYGPGITADTALAGWSMSKSIMNALVGILVKQGKVSPDQPVPIPEWSGQGDRRKAITLDNLLRMSSGLEFDERSGPFVSDVNRMLLRSRDAAAYALAKPLKHEPGKHWQYSSGTTNIISRIIRNSVGGSEADYHAFPRKALFDKIGMTGAVMEVDVSGTFVGSSFTYATARDWARFGQLYLQDGVWEGERILPEGWVSYSARPASAAPLGRYGAHFWTNGNGFSPGKQRPFPKLPIDAFFASGYGGQYVVIVPSRKLVVVRLGLNRIGNAWDMQSFVADVIEVIDRDFFR